MEEGSLRCDANVSVRPAGSTTLGTKAEVKNLNSFRFLQKALEYEIERQIDLLEDGGRVVQETRLWDAAAGVTVSMRSKEEAHDYRYFPEPDLPPVVVDAGAARRGRARRCRSCPTRGGAGSSRSYALPDTTPCQLTQSRALADYFEEAVGAGADAEGGEQLDDGRAGARAERTAGRRRRRSAGDAPAALAGLLALDRRRHDQRRRSPRTSSRRCSPPDARPPTIVAREGLAQIDDESQIVALIAEVLSRNADAVAQYRGGKTTAFGFLVGQVMKAAAGKANPKRVNELLRKVLEAPKLIKS